MRDALILAGGRGTRLGGLTKTTPKPLVEVGGRPFIDHLVWNLARHGVRRIIVSTGHLAEAFEAHFADVDAVRNAAAGHDVEVVVINEIEPLGTGGAIAFAAGALTTDEAVVLNGDTLFEVNYLDLVLLRKQTETELAIALRRLPDAERYGSVRLDGGLITEFAEKAGSGEGLVSGGVYIADTGLLRALPCGKHSFEFDVLPRLAAAGRLSGRAYDGWFVDIGTPESLAYAKERVADWRGKSAVLLDRDGVINVDHGHVATPEQFEWVPGAPQAIKHLNDAGVLAIVVTNQAGIAKGYYTEQEYLAFERWIDERLAEHGAHLDATYHCPHHPDAQGTYGGTCECRKPEPGMVRAAIHDFGLTTARTVLLGDRATDIEAATSAGLRGVLFDHGDLGATIERILSEFEESACT